MTVTENKTETLFSFPQISFNPKSNECQQIHTFITTSLVVIEHVNYVEVSNKVIRVLTQVTGRRLELFLKLNVA